MPTSFTEGKHAGEFIISEASGTRSREVVTVASGQNLVDGQAIQLSGGKAIAKNNTLNTEGEFTGALIGFIIGNWDRTADGPEGATDAEGVPYIARDAEVKDSALTKPSGVDDELEAAAKSLGIIFR